MWEYITAILLIQIITVPIHVSYLLAIRREHKKNKRVLEAIWRYYQKLKLRKGIK